MERIKNKTFVEFNSDDEYELFLKKIKGKAGYLEGTRYDDEVISTVVVDGDVDEIDNIIALSNFSVENGIEFVIRERVSEDGWEGSYFAIGLLDELGFKREEFEEEDEDIIFEGNRDELLEELGLEDVIEYVEKVFDKLKLDDNKLREMEREIEIAESCDRWEGDTKLAQQIFNMNYNEFNKYGYNTLHKLKMGEINFKEKDEEQEM